MIDGYDMKYVQQLYKQQDEIVFKEVFGLRTEKEYGMFFRFTGIGGHTITIEGNVSVGDEYLTMEEKTYFIKTLIAGLHAYDK